MVKKIQLLQKQHEFLFSDEKMLLFLGGIGTGKTHVLSHVMLKHIIDYPESNILCTANTYSQLMNTVVPAFTTLLDEMGIKYTSALGGTKKHITVGNVVVHLYSLENPSVIRGLEVGLFVCDEFCHSTLNALNICLGRLRCKKGSLNARFTSSPNGHNWVYDLVQDNKIKTVQATSYDNHHLPAEYLETLEDLYVKGSALYKQEVLGEFVNLQAEAVYHAFNRKDHVKETKYIEHYPIYIGTDYNVSNMSAIFVQIIDGVYRVIKELKLTDASSNTFELAEQLHIHYPNAIKRIAGDSTGLARKSSSMSTDIQILKDAGHNVLATRNPRIVDRQNNVNRFFLNNKIQIDPSCTTFIKELETLTHSQTEGKVSHLGPAFGYVCWKLEPISKPQLKNTRIKNPFIR